MSDPTRMWARRPEGGPDEQSRNDAAPRIITGADREYAVRPEGGPDEAKRAKPQKDAKEVRAEIEAALKEVEENSNREVTPEFSFASREEAEKAVLEALGEEKPKEEVKVIKVYKSKKE